MPSVSKMNHCGGGNEIFLHLSWFISHGLLPHQVVPQGVAHDTCEEDHTNRGLPFEIRSTQEASQFTTSQEFNLIVWGKFSIPFEIWIEFGNNFSTTLLLFFCVIHGDKVRHPLLWLLPRDFFFSVSVRSSARRYAIQIHVWTLASCLPRSQSVFWSQR